MKHLMADYDCEECSITIETNNEGTVIHIEDENKNLITIDSKTALKLVSILPNAIKNNNNAFKGISPNT